MSHKYTFCTERAVRQTRSGHQYGYRYEIRNERQVVVKRGFTLTRGEAQRQYRIFAGLE